jgi:hypothetical protein
MNPKGMYSYVLCACCGRTVQAIDFHGYPHTLLCPAPLMGKEVQPGSPCALAGYGDRTDARLMSMVTGLRLTHAAKASAGMTVAERRACEFADDMAESDHGCA